MHAVWKAVGSKPATDGQVEGIANNEVVGAVNALAPHPSDPNILYVGAVNGGVWRTDSAASPQPSWQPMTERLPSLSIGALAMEPLNETLVAGTGRFSSNASKGGNLLGVIVSTDHGKTWTVHDNTGVFRKLHVRSIIVKNRTILICANARSNDPQNGVYRSTDLGLTWSQISGNALPRGASFSIAGDPHNPNRVYVDASGRAIFRSDDFGATWKKASDQKIENLLAKGISNLKLSAGPASTVFLGVADRGLRALSALYRSPDAGNTWTSLDLPETKEFRRDRFGVHPGRQAGHHFSLAAHPTEANIVFVGGDRQPTFDEGPNGHAAPHSWPNSLQAFDYSGRLFKVDASRPAGRQAEAITHKFTRSGSAPHADSRCMAFDANAELIEGDDGGVYRRTRPASRTGDWTSLNGDLQISEFHSVAFDPLSQTIIGGAQDTGTQQQIDSADTEWPSVSTGDGGVVAASITRNPSVSVRYSSYQNLGDLRRIFFNSNGVQNRRERVKLAPIPGGSQLAPQFYTPILIHPNNPRRLIFGAANGVFESFNQGDTVVELRPIGIRVNSASALACGADNDDELLWVGDGQDLWVRTKTSAPMLQRASYLPQPGTIQGIAIDHGDPDTAFVTTEDRVFITYDAGSTWTDVTGDIDIAGAKTLRTVVFAGNLNGGVLFVGSNTGVYASDSSSLGTWSKVGSGFPAAPVLQMQYNEKTKMLICGTLGRGAFTATFNAGLSATADV